MKTSTNKIEETKEIVREAQMPQNGKVKTKQQVDFRRTGPRGHQ